MKVYRKDKNGFIEELNTEGSYRPKGWSLTKEAAKKRGNSKKKGIKMGRAICR